MKTCAERVQNQPAYLLHAKAYRETSALLDFFTRDRGRQRALARGIRRPGARQRDLMRPFQPLEIGWQGGGELKTLSQGEATAPSWPLQGRPLWCGLYVNELLSLLLPADQATPRLFAYYALTLEQLADPEMEEAALRLFERRLLEEIGYGIGFERDTQGEAIMPSGHYYFDPQAGFIACGQEDVRGVLEGAQLLAIAEDDFRAASVRRAAKAVMRQALRQQLGGRTLKSRAFFIASAPDPAGVAEP